MWEWAALGLGEKLAADCARPGLLQGDCVQSNLTLNWAEPTFEPSLNPPSNPLLPQTLLINSFRPQGITMNIWYVTFFSPFRFFFLPQGKPGNRGSRSQEEFQISLVSAFHYSWKNTDFLCLCLLRINLGWAGFYPSLSLKMPTFQLGISGLSQQ